MTLRWQSQWVAGVGQNGSHKGLYCVEKLMRLQGMETSLSSLNKFASKGR